MIIPKLIGKFKMLSSKKINFLRNSEGNKIWQRNYYEHIIRNEVEYLKISEYIENNPILWEKDKYFK